MNPIYFTIAVLATLSVLVIPLAQATESTQITAVLIGNSEIDANGEVVERLVRAYAEFTNFEISDGYFNVDVIQLQTGKVVSSSKVMVHSSSTGPINIGGILSTTSSGKIDFGSMVGYLVNDKDICSYKMSIHENACADIITGNYQIEISTRNGIMANPVQFSIQD